MPTARVLDALHALARPADECSDADHMRLFLARHDEAAFAELVRRHGPMVYGVCRRTLAGGPDADDAFQATFLVLARKAGTVRGNVGSWLYGVAVKVANKARVQAVKRRVRHMAAAKPEAVHPPAPTADLWAVIDEELAKLPAELRQAVLACDVNGQTRSQAAKALGWPEGTVAKRLATARDRLARQLTRRGVTLSISAVSVALADVTAAVPGTLAAETVRQAAAFAVGGSGISLAAQTLAEGVLRSIKVGAFKLFVAIGLLAATVAGGSFMLAGGPPDEKKGERPKAKLEPAKAAVVWREKTTLEFPGTLPVSVAYSADGKAMAVGDTSGTVTAFDTATDKKLWTSAVGGSHTAVVFSADQKTVYATFDAGVRMLAAADGKRHGIDIQPVPPADGGPVALGVFPDRRLTDETARSQVVFANARNVYVSSWAVNATTGAVLPDTAGSLELRTAPRDRLTIDVSAVPLAVDPKGRSAIMTGPRDAKTGRNVLWAYACGDYEKDSPGNRLLEGHAGIVVAAAWSADGATAVTGDGDGRVFVWDAKTMKERHHLELGGRVAALALSPDGTHTAAYVLRLKQGEVYVWETAKPTNTMRPIHTENGDFGGTAIFASLTFSPDGKRLAGCAGDRAWLTRLGELVGKVRVWELADGRTGAAGSGRAAPVMEGIDARSVAFAPDGRTFAVGERGGHVTLWDTATRTRRWASEAFDPGATASVAFSPDGTDLALGDGRRVIFLKAATGKAFREWTDIPSDVVAYWPAQKRLIGTNGLSLTARTVPPQAGNADVRIGTGGGGGGIGRLAAGVALQPNGPSMAHVVQKHDTADRAGVIGPKDKPLLGHAGACFAVAWSPDGKTIATGGNDGCIVLWSGADFDTKREIQTDDGDVHALAFAPDGRTLYAGTAVATAVTGWDLATGTATFRRAVGGPAVTGLTFSPDGKLLLVATGDPFGPGTAEGRVELWPAAGLTERAAPTRREVAALRGAEPQSVAFAPDGTAFVVGTGDGGVTAWDAATLKPLWKFDAESRGVVGLAVSPAGDEVSVVNGVAGHHLDAKAGTQRQAWASMSGYAVAYSRDGKRIAMTDSHFLGWTDVALAVRLTDRPPGPARPGEKLNPCGVAWSPDGTRLAALCQPVAAVTASNVLLVAPDDPAVPQRFLERDERLERLHALVWSKDGKTILAGGDGGRVLVWSGANFAKRREVKTGGWNVRSLALSPDGKTVYAGLTRLDNPTARQDKWVRSACVKGFDLETGEVTFTRTMSGPAVTALAVNGRSMVVASGPPPFEAEPSTWDHAGGRVELWAISEN